MIKNNNLIEFAEAHFESKKNEDPLNGIFPLVLVCVGMRANCSQEPKSNFNLLMEGFYADTAFPHQLIVAIRNCHSQLSFGLS
jgi:hypothetical protein